MAPNNTASPIRSQKELPPVDELRGKVDELELVDMDKKTDFVNKLYRAERQACEQRDGARLTLVEICHIAITAGRAVGADKSLIQYAAIDKLILYTTGTSIETILREGVIG
jgi:hypothetical protein